MDNLVTLKFFTVHRTNAHGAEFDEALRFAHAMGAHPSERERNIQAGEARALIVRLERLDETEDYLSGELIRKQISNIPPEANDLGLTKIKLSEGGGLGLSSAFTYHRKLNVLCIQNNNRAVSCTRLNLYLNCIKQHFDFEFDPIVTSDAWTRFNNGEPRKIHMRLGKPKHFVEFDGKNSPIGQSVADLGEMLHAPFITIEVSMGSRRGSLAVEETKSFIKRLLAFRKKKAGTVESLKVSIAGDDENDMIDFLEEHLTVKDELDLSDEDPEKNYAVRASFLASKFDVHLPYLHKIYAP